MLEFDTALENWNAQLPEHLSFQSTGFQTSEPAHQRQATALHCR